MPARIVQAAIQGHLDIVVSESLLTEYRRTLQKPKLRKFHQLSDAEIDAFVAAVDVRAETLEPGPAALSAPDPDDQHLSDLLAEVADVVLVTGDAALRQSADFPGRILTPRGLVDRFEL